MATAETALNRVSESERKNSKEIVPVHEQIRSESAASFPSLLSAPLTALTLILFPLIPAMIPKYTPEEIWARRNGFLDSFLAAHGEPKDDVDPVAAWAALKRHPSLAYSQRLIWTFYPTPICGPREASHRG